MVKLHLKRTPEEEAARHRRKQQIKDARRKRGQHHYDDTEPGSSHPHSRKRQRTTENPVDHPERKWASSDEEKEQYGPQPAPSTSSSGHTSRRHKPDGDELRTEVEEIRFRAKMFDAFADDERLDSLEARLNDYAHVPGHWRTESSKARFNVSGDDEWLKMDPQDMDEEEYAEWVRMGMYRKTHATEYAEQQRQKAAQAAQRTGEKKKREETARLAKAAEEERNAKKRERDARRWAYARDVYHSKWKALQNSNNNTLEERGEVSFSDIPWPVLEAHRERSKHRAEAVAVTVDDLTVESISAFLLPDGEAEGERSRKEVLRETFLRFHPDKFEGRFMKTVREGEQEAVREGIGRVVRALNTLLAV